MAKVHDIGKQHFVQLLTNYRAQWGFRIAVKGTTTELEAPYRRSNSWMIRLPFYSVLVIGKWEKIDWLNQLDWKTTLLDALQGRELTDEDFQEGWTAPAYQAPEPSSLGSDY